MNTMKPHILQHMAARLRLLILVYHASQASTRRATDARALALADGQTIEEFKKAFAWLEGEALINPYGTGYTCTLTHQGLKAVEEAVSNPRQGTPYFPALAHLGISME